MNPTVAVVVVILLAALAANLPFVNERLFGVIPLSRAGGMLTHGRKAFWLRLLELAVLYFVVGGVARLLEAQLGGLHVQRWEFYAITACLFIVLAYPGFVHRYMRRRHD